MKKLIMTLSFALVAIIMVAQTVTETTVLDPTNTPVSGANWTEWLYWGLSILLFMWETIIRLVPTAKNWSLAVKIVGILDFVAKLFNGVGNVAKTENGKAKFVNTKVPIE